MKCELSKIFRFEAAHDLPNFPDGHKCRRLHGHSFVIEVHVVGDVDPHTGCVVDFGDLGRVVKPYIDQLDHRYLNDIAGLENPTSENLAIWIWNRIVDQLPGLDSVEVRETCTTRCIYRGA